MDLRDQVARFRALLQDHEYEVDAFALNVDGDNFKTLLAGGQGGLEVLCRGSGVTINYACDGTPAWLETFAADLTAGKFGGSNT